MVSATLSALQTTVLGGQISSSAATDRLKIFTAACKPVLILQALILPGQGEDKLLAKVLAGTRISRWT